MYTSQNDKLILKFIWKIKEPRITKTTLQKSIGGLTHSTRLQILLKNYSN